MDCELFYVYFRCKCGNCYTSSLTNAKECKCCKEIEGFVNALKDETVIKQVGKEPNCITSHPDFAAVCLNCWTLHLSAGLFKTRVERKYKRIGSEERYLNILYI